MRKITIEPVTRIEGHAKITINLDDNGNVEHAYMHVNEFRGFEKFCEGRMYFEMPQITPRICGICPVSHHLAAAKTNDALVGSPPPRPAVLTRRLMHMGQIIQSHGLHFFELAAPDMLLGFDSDPATRNVVGLIKANPELATKAVLLRKFGQDVIRVVGGRKLHPNFCVPGGVNKAFTQADKDEIMGVYDENLDTIHMGLNIIKDWASKNQKMIDEFGVFKTGYGGLVNKKGGLEMYDGEMRIIDSNADLWTQFDPANYLDYISEHVEPWTYLKFPYYIPEGYPGGSYRVGPLGRLNMVDEIGTPLAQSEWEEYRQINDGNPIENTLHYHYARLIETLYCMERVRELCEDEDITSTEIVNTKTDYQGEGVGVIEAPRGTLIHHYKADDTGKLDKVNLIVSTGHNNYAMTHAVDSVAKTYIKNGDVREGLLNRVEAAIRAHDPCLSCSTHAVGQMPMDVEINDADGKLIQNLRRDS